MKRYSDIERIKKIVGNTPKIIVTRHPALVEYMEKIGLIDGETEIVSHATPEVVRDKAVYGVLPLSLAKEADVVIEIPIIMPPDLRGKELTLADMSQYAQPPKIYFVHEI